MRPLLKLCCALSDWGLDHVHGAISAVALDVGGLQVVREIVTLERMHRAFDSGLMEYGMAKAVKKASAPKAAVERPAYSSAA